MNAPDLSNAMKLSNPRLWIGLCSGLVVLLVAFVDMGRKSPGPLTSVHQREESLMARNGCADCHGGFFSGMQSSCFECHQVIDEQMQAGTGLHGVIDQGVAARCGTCHSEHHGARFSIVNRQSFIQAGVLDPDQFDHNLIGFAMDGEHLELDCSECHQHAETEVLPEGAFRFGGLRQACADCHEDPHEGQFTAVGCTDCHSQAAWEELFSEGHDGVLPLVGGHGDVSCRECHAEDDLHALEVVGSSAGRPEARACLDCHESPHDDEFLSGSADYLAMAEPASCVSCHTEEHESFREPTDLDFDLHAFSGFPLALPHDEVGCEECHAPESDDFAERYPGRGPEECSVCHADPHAGQFETGPFSALAVDPAPGAGECTACHADVEWEPHVFDVEKHARAALELDGLHLDADCHACHLPDEDPDRNGVRTFRGTPSDCDRCHDDAHRNFFAPVEGELAEAEHGSCAACHLTTGFEELRGDSFDHARFADFPLKGAHAQESCESCHVPQPRDDDGRSFGFVEDHFGVVEGCADCHEDPHRGAFDRPEMPQSVQGRNGCARCHVEVSFRVFKKDFNHERWTGFALEQSHAQVGCTDCHEPKEEPAASGLTWGEAPGTSCADCHSDPHGGQFVDYLDVNDCSRCHTPANFGDTIFRHDWDSSFELGEAHRAVACSACHSLEPHNGGSIVRYKPLSGECSSCHGVQEGQLRKRRRKNR